VYHHKGYRKLGRMSSHRKALFRNLSCSFIMSGKVKTLFSISKELRRVAERMITLCKKGRLSVLASVLQNAEAFKKIQQIADKYKDRKGGYTRIIKTGLRKGDGAPTAIIEFVE